MPNSLQRFCLSNFRHDENGSDEPSLHKNTLYCKEQSDTSHKNGRYVDDGCELKLASLPHLAMNQGHSAAAAAHVLLDKEAPKHVSNLDRYETNLNRADFG